MSTNYIRKSYKELMSLSSFKERFQYLQIKGIVGHETFGSSRYLNQTLYNSPEWRSFRRDIIIRDNGCDLGIEGYDIRGRIIIHHINPISIEDVINRSSFIFDPNNVICVSHNTHEAIHYSDESILITEPVTRTPNDTCLWKR